MPHLPPLLTQSLLHSIRTQPHLPPHAWYFVTGVTLSILNRPDELPKVLSHALKLGAGSGSDSERFNLSNNNTGGTATESIEARDHDSGSGSTTSREEQILIARKLREALIKSAAIGGLPKVCVS